MKCLITIILILFGLQVFSQENNFTNVADPKLVESKLTEASKTINTISSDFIQEKHLEYLSVIIESQGKFWFKKPSMLRWEYTKPFKYVVVINDGKINIMDEDRKTEFDVNSSKAFQDLNDIIVNSVNGTLIASDKYNFEILENDEYWLVRLFPKSDQLSDVLQQMELFFLKSDLSVQKIKMIENDKDYTKISFINKDINKGISESVFQID